MTEVLAPGDKILVGLAVVGAPATDEIRHEVERWQVLTVADGQIADIRAFDNRSEAAGHAGRPS